MLYVITQLSSQSLSIPRGEIHPTMAAAREGGGGQPRSHYRLPAGLTSLPSPAAAAAIAAAFPASAAAIAVAGGAAHETGTAMFDRQRRAGERASLRGMGASSARSGHRVLSVLCVESARAVIRSTLS